MNIVNREYSENSKTVFTVLTILLMTSIPTYFYFSNITWTTQFEESVGFRYFHSIRILYGNEYPFVPQGHLTALIHYLIQHILTIAGYRTDVIFPRVDLFCLAAVLIPLFMAGICFYWAITPLRTLTARYIFCIFFLCSFFSPRFQDGWMLLPDYHIGIVSVALLGCGWCFRILTASTYNSEFTMGTAILLGIYAGACAGIKITLLTYPLLIALIFISMNRNWTTIARLAWISAPVTVLIWIGILYLYFNERMCVVFSYLHYIYNYTRAEVHLSQQDMYGFISIFKPMNILDIFPLIPITVAISIISLLSKTRHSVPSILAPVLLIELYMIYNRNYTHSYIEMQFLFFIAFNVMLMSIWHNKSALVLKHLNTLKTTNKELISFLIIVSLSVYPLSAYTKYYADRVFRFKTYLTSYNTGNHGIQLGLQQIPGKTLFLLPGNIETFNLHSIDNGMYKALSHNQKTWRQGIYLAQLFPDRWYATDPSNLPNLENYDKLVFRTYMSETIPEALQRLTGFYGKDFSEFNCERPYFEYNLPTKETIVLCSKHE